MPRVDLILETDYLDGVYQPLSPSVDRAYGLDGAVPIAIPLRLRALSSPWLIGVTGGGHDAQTFAEIHGVYTDRFLDLLADPPATSLTADRLRHRDGDHRFATFNAATDPVWDILTDLVGAAAVEAILSAVRTPVG
jgi:hypothetical protein